MEAKRPANQVSVWADSIPEPMQLLLCDAQTSGGMLIAVEPARAAELLERLEHHKTPVAAQIGEVVEKREELIEVIA